MTQAAWQSKNGRVKLYLGDAKDVISEVDNIDSVITDPPYNIGYCYGSYKDNLSWHEYFTWQLDILVGIKPKIVPNGNLLWLNYPEPAAVMWSRLLEHYHPVEWITWVSHTHNGGKPLRKGARSWIWLSNSVTPYVNDEPLKGEYRNPTDRRIKKCIAEGKKPRDMDWWLYEPVKNVSKEKTKHPCQLPLAMVQRLVEASCPPDGTVLDFFVGSGTAAEACVRTGRKFVGIEMDPDYFKIAVNRVEQATAEIS